MDEKDPKTKQLIECLDQTSYYKLKESENV